MKRLGNLCTTALAIAVCSFALMGCSNIDGKTGPSEPNPGSTEAAEETTPRGSFDKINEDEIDPQGLSPDPQEQFPIDLEVDENVHVTCVGKDTDGYVDAALVFTVSNNTGVDMMFGDVDSYAYVNGKVRDVRMRQQVAAGEETRAMLTFVAPSTIRTLMLTTTSTTSTSTFGCSKRQRATFTLGTWYTSHRRRCDALTKQGIQHKTRDDPTGSPLVYCMSAMRAALT